MTISMKKDSMEENFTIFSDEYCRECFGDLSYIFYLQNGSCQEGKVKRLLKSSELKSFNQKQAKLFLRKLLLFKFSLRKKKQTEKRKPRLGHPATEPGRTLSTRPRRKTEFR